MESLIIFTIIYYYVFTKKKSYIKMVLKQIGRKGADWIKLTQNKRPVVGYCEHDNEISACIKKGIP